MTWLGKPSRKNIYFDLDIVKVALGGGGAARGGGGGGGRGGESHHSRRGPSTPLRGEEGRDEKIDVLPRVGILFVGGSAAGKENVSVICDVPPLRPRGNRYDSSGRTGGPGSVPTR